MLLDDVLSRGYARLRLDARQTDALADLHAEAVSFFARTPEDKLRHSVPARTTGYRPYAYAHAGIPDKPDLNDSYLHWKRRGQSVPNASEIKEFVDALEIYRGVAVSAVHRLLDELRAHYGYTAELPFEDASVLQVNSFTQAGDAELLQQEHEDAVMLTVIWASRSGLEAVRDGRIEPIGFPPDEIVLMPGSILTLMTGGEIPPLYHHARNNHFDERKSIMYFVSPDVDAPIVPFKVTDLNRGADIRQRVIDNPQTFGLAEDFVQV